MHRMKNIQIALVSVAAAFSLHAAQVYTVPNGERIYPGYAVKVDGYHNNLHVFADAADAQERDHPDDVILEVGKDAVSPKFVVSDAKRMGAKRPKVVMRSPFW